MTSCATFFRLYTEESIPISTNSLKTGAKGETLLIKLNIVFQSCRWLDVNSVSVSVNIVKHIQIHKKSQIKWVNKKWVNMSHEFVKR